MPEETNVPISSFPDASSIDGADKVTGLQNNANTNFKFSTILAWLVNAFRAAFVPVGRTVNNKSLASDITLTAQDVGARPDNWTPSAADVGAVPTTAAGAPLGVAELDSSGKVPTNQLPAIPSQPSDIGAQPTITANGILKGDVAGGVSAATPGTDYGTYSKPSGGIPANDMTSAVQTSLGKADTAYQKPSGGIPSSDMASGVQTSLGKADTAYQKPSGGIPASDLANGVIPTVPSAYTSNPAMDGTASPGTSNDYARGDHVHPTDSTKAAKSDLTSIQATGSANTTGAAIPSGEYFYLNGVLCRAKTQIDVNATFTVNTNYEQATVGSILTGTSVSGSAIGMPGISVSRIRAGIVFLNIYDFKPSSASGTISGTLPQELRPIQTTSGMVLSADGTKYARISISTQGVVTYTGVDTSRYHYGLISYPAAI